MLARPVGYRVYSCSRSALSKLNLRQTLEMIHTTSACSSHRVLSLHYTDVLRTHLYFIYTWKTIKMLPGLHRPDKPLHTYSNSCITRPRPESETESL